MVAPRPLLESVCLRSRTGSRAESPALASGDSRVPLPWTRRALPVPARRGRARDSALLVLRRRGRRVRRAWVRAPRARVDAPRLRARRRVGARVRGCVGRALLARVDHAAAAALRDVLPHRLDDLRRRAGRAADAPHAGRCPAVCLGDSVLRGHGAHGVAAGPAQLRTGTSARPRAALAALAALAAVATHFPAVVAVLAHTTAAAPSSRTCRSTVRVATARRPARVRGRCFFLSLHHRELQIDMRLMPHLPELEPPPMLPPHLHSTQTPETNRACSRSHRARRHCGGRTLCLAGRARAHQPVLLRVAVIALRRFSGVELLDRGADTTAISGFAR